MAIEVEKKLVLKRVPPGDQWTDAVDDSDVFPTLTDGLEYVFQKSNGKITEFHLSAFKGQIYSVQDIEVPDVLKKRVSTGLGYFDCVLGGEGFTPSVSNVGADCPFLLRSSACMSFFLIIFLLLPPAFLSIRL